MRSVGKGGKRRGWVLMGEGGFSGKKTEKAEKGTFRSKDTETGSGWELRATQGAGGGWLRCGCLQLETNSGIRREAGSR